MKQLWKSNSFWEIIGYASLALNIIGQITVGYVYLLAQGLYLVGNIMGVTRSFVLNQPRADKVRNIVFLAITCGLIIIKIFSKTP